MRPDICSCLVLSKADLVVRHQVQARVGHNAPMAEICCTGIAIPTQCRHVTQLACYMWDSAYEIMCIGARHIFAVLRSAAVCGSALFAACCDV